MIFESKRAHSVLIQERRVVAYPSRELKDHENNYLIHDLELVKRWYFP